MKESGNNDDDDEAVFRAAMADVRPIECRVMDPYRRKRRAEPLRLEHAEDEADDLADLPVETGDFLSFKRPGIQHRVMHDLARGLIDTQGSLDLHGMRVHEARPALLRFLAYSLASGRRCVRIIHGKGRGCAGQQPVLKQKIDQWLRQRSEVLAYVTTPRWDGGTGAVYVLLSAKQRRIDE